MNEEKAKDYEARVGEDEFASCFPISLDVFNFETWGWGDETTLSVMTISWGHRWNPVLYIYRDGTGLREQSFYFCFVHVWSSLDGWFPSIKWTFVCIMNTKKRLYTNNGLTVRELKKFIASWPEEDYLGNPTEVWIETGFCSSSVVVCAEILNERENRGDLLLSSNAYEHKINELMKDNEYT